jgi:hypothetical protein
MNPSQRIDRLIAAITDWRGKTFAGIRKAILAADRKIIEEWKWMGSPVWSRDGIIAVANAHKGKVKLTFAYGAKLRDPDKLFNAGLEGNARRAINFFEGDKINERALKNLVRAAIDYNQAKLKKNAPTRAKTQKTKKQKLKRPDAFTFWPWRRASHSCAPLRPRKSPVSIETGCPPGRRSYRRRRRPCARSRGARYRSATRGSHPRTS